MDFSIKIFCYNFYLKYSKIFARLKIHHFGLQRSGTNLLAKKLQIMDCMVLNAIDPERSSIKHKHFRIQNNKNTISNKLYYNQEYIYNLNDLVERLYTSKDFFFVGVYKDPFAWIESMCRWERTDKKLGDHEINVFVESQLSDWFSYYSAWYKLSKSNPDKVILLDIDDILNPDLNKLIYSNLFFRLKGERINKSTLERLCKSVYKVPHSRVRSQERVNNMKFFEDNSLRIDELKIDCQELYTDMKRANLGVVV